MSIAQSSPDNRDPVGGVPDGGVPDGNVPDADSPCTCVTARRAARHLTREYDRALKPAGLKVTQYSVLCNLLESGGLSITALADRLAMDRTTLTRNLRPLERAGWIVLRDGPDRRSRAVEITSAGMARHEQARPLWQSAERTFRGSMGRQEARELRRLLDVALNAAAMD